MHFFTEKLETSQGRLNFYFNRIYTVEGTRYHISVAENDRKGHSFNVYHSEGKWKLVNPDNCPGWVVELEDEISNAIDKHKSEAD